MPLFKSFWRYESYILYNKASSILTLSALSGCRESLFIKNYKNDGKLSC